MDKQNCSSWKCLLGAAAVVGAVAGLTVCAVRSRAAWLEAQDFCDDDDNEDWECDCGCNCSCDCDVPPEVTVTPDSANETESPTVPEGDDEDFEQY